MKITLVFFGSISLLAAVVVFLNAKSAIHEILAGVAFLGFAIFACAGAVIGAIERSEKNQCRLLDDIARNSSKGGSHGTSAVRYQIPGLND